MQEEQQANQQEQPPSITWVREDDFRAVYANNVLTEQSVWDMKVIFGVLDQSVQPNRVLQHTSVNLPWAQIKLLAYYLRIGVAWHESQNGKIAIPPSVMPPDPETFLTVGQTAPDLIELAAKIHKDFMASL